MFRISPTSLSLFTHVYFFAAESPIYSYFRYGTFTREEAIRLGGFSRFYFPFIGNSNECPIDGRGRDGEARRRRLLRSYGAAARGRLLLSAREATERRPAAAERLRPTAPQRAAAGNSPIIPRRIPN